MVRKVNDALVVDYKYKKYWKQKILLMSDVHFDSVYCKRNLLREHLNYALREGAQVFIFGDLFDCMGGKYDRRADKSVLRAKYRVKNYFDAVMDDAVEFFTPYKEVIKFVSDGNHEVSILKHNETDLIKRFTDAIGCERGGYSGFIRFKFEHVAGSHRTSQVMYYNHGSSGNSPVTKGVIRSNRRQVSIDADIYVSGHNHNEWIVPLTVAKLSSGNVLKIEKKLHINTGCYKQEWGKGDFSQMREFDPENLGCVEIEWVVKQKKVYKSYRVLEI